MTRSDGKQYEKSFEWWIYSKSKTNYNINNKIIDNLEIHYIKSKQDYLIGPGVSVSDYEVLGSISGTNTVLNVD